ncbi:PAS domain S-box protein [Rhodocytophaga rosea]|uniref:histidine kinase n=1 Tax=Rhodocytophaga rosea TaxID=2704465 RepID=A0A6C0GLQ0_9BACT|nr:PAS domain S-box protein [Rhodocytophaga rosea]QHT68867.1 PAS domain S-box protein [Rhodocytophaga rosea]
MNNLNTTLLTTLQNLTEVGVIATDEKGGIHFFNKGAQQLLGYTPEEVLSTDISFLIYTNPESKSQHNQLQILTLHPEGRHTFIHQTRQRIFVALSIQPYAEEDSSPGGYILTFTSVQTEEKTPESQIASQSIKQQTNEAFDNESTLPHAIFENIVLTKGGQRIPVEISTNIPAAEEITTNLALIKDFSQHKGVEQEIQNAQAAFKAIFDESPIGVSIVDETDRLIQINQSHCRMLGYQKEELLNMRFSDFTHPEDIQATAEVRQSILKGEINSYQLEKRLLTKNRGYIWVRLTRIGFKQNNHTFIVGITEDITERKKWEEELMRAKQQAEETALTKQQFLSTMSHELRTPMNAVIGLTHLLLLENPLPDQVENLQMLKFSSENLLALINDILDFSKIEAGKVSLENVNFSIRSLVISIINSLQLKANEKGIALVMRIDEQIPQLVTGDPVRLTQILNNLLSNAIKFTQKGSVTLSIALEQVLSNHVQLHFSVTDTGIGIPADKLTHIFESFSQAGNDTTRKYGGTGLGLAITKRLLELQGSTIQVESTLGEGSTFYFSLKIGSTIAGQEKASLYANTEKFITLESLRLLLVEDNEINQMIATKFLTKWNIYPDYANNGREAVEKVKQNHYDVILMDLQMPEMNGYEATHTIRSFGEERFKQIPIIALTADAVIDVKERAIAAGMSDFITKPFNPDELYQKLVRYASKSQEDTQTSFLHTQQVEATKMLLSYKQVYELAAGDMIFVEQLIHSSIDQIQQFKGMIHDIVEAKNKYRFDSAVHKIQPMIRLFEMNLLAQHLEETRTLMENSSITFEQLNYKIIDIMRACSTLTEKLAQPQHQS